VQQRQQSGMFLLIPNFDFIEFLYVFSGKNRAPLSVQFPCNHVDGTECRDQIGHHAPDQTFR
jgi:hypothetical protein